ncbi:MAG TPA: pyridoxal-dependent decarboxylase [Polyangia bacterium]|nr:pyridoxal-dependent decarboxylase [Polyangia bacterium]
MDPPEKSSRPFDLAAEPLEEALGRASALCVEIFRRLEERPVRPPVDRAALERALRDSLPDQGVGLLAALDDFARLILPASMGIPHPLYLGLVNSSPLPGPVLADLLISALNNNGGAFEQSPALTACEDEVVRQLARRFGWPDDSEGLFLPGGSFANLQALVLAREQACPGGGIDAGLRLYTAESAHFSVTRAARIAGFGPAQVVALPGRGRGELDMAALAARLDADRRAGLRPTAVVVTIGTTGTGALDDVAAAAELCRHHGSWLHVDACYGGAAVLLPELAARFAGVAQADSIAVDPHKWFFVPVTAAALLTRHRALALSAFSARASSYVPRAGAPDAWERGMPTTRRASGFAVWMALRAHGWDSIRQAVARNIALTRRLEGRLAAAGFRVLPAGELSIACARWEPPGRSPAALDGLQTTIAERVIATGQAWFSTVEHQGLRWLRFNLVNLHTRVEHMDRLAALLADTAQAAT